MTRGGRLRVAVVGAGLMGRWHGKAALRAGGRLVAVVDQEQTRAEALARVLGAPTTRRELAELLHDHVPDVVHVCTPLDSHYAVALAGLEAGCHVIVEKPLVRTSSETVVLLDRAREGGTLLCPTHQFLFQRGVLQLQARRAALGDLRHMRMTACSAGADGGDDGLRDEVAMEILPHFLAFVARLGTEPMEAMEWALYRSGPGELQLVGRGEAATATALVSMSGRSTRNEFEWIGTQGSAHLDLYHGFATFDRGEPSRRGKLLRPFDRGTRTLLHAGGQLAARTLRWEPAYPGLRELVGRFYAAVRSGGPSPIAEDEVLAVARVWERLQRDTASPAGNGA